jgi:hypothetical protein
MRVAGPVEFVPVGIIGPAPDDPPPSSGHQDDPAGRIEIDLPSGARIRVRTPSNWR